MEPNNELEQRAKLTIYDKLNDCRLAFKNANVKKSGKNTYAGYDYFELDDILNALIPILASNRATTMVNFTPEGATLTFTDCVRNQGKHRIYKPYVYGILEGLSRSTEPWSCGKLHQALPVSECV